MASAQGWHVWVLSIREHLLLLVALRLLIAPQAHSCLLQPPHDFRRLLSNQPPKLQVLCRQCKGVVSLPSDRVMWRSTRTLEHSGSLIGL